VYLSLYTNRYRLTILYRIVTLRILETQAGTEYDKDMDTHDAAADNHTAVTAAHAWESVRLGNAVTDEMSCRFIHPLVSSLSSVSPSG